MLTDNEFRGLCRRLYRSVRDGAVDREAAFDLSAEVLAAVPFNELAARVAEGAVADADPALLASTAGEWLASFYEPDFEDEPGLFAALEAALEIVKADLRACGLPDAVRLYIWDGPPAQYARVDAWAANSTGGGIHPAEGKDPLTALVAVADDAQDAVMHSVWGAWPTCPEHRLGAHAREHDGAAVWWCASGSGHAVARVGQWPRG